jgi:hypothetical protein
MRTVPNAYRMTIVRIEVAKSGFTFSMPIFGIGSPDGSFAQAKTELGAKGVEALAHHNSKI